MENENEAEKRQSTEQQTSHEDSSEKLSCDNLRIQLDQDGATQCSNINTFSRTS